MGTRSNFVSTALADLGYRESPSNSNRTKYGEWIGLQGQPWCMSAVQYWAHKADVRLPVKTGSCTTLMNAAKQTGQWVTDNYRAGDIVIFEWSNGQRHCGIVALNLGNYLQTVEGNTAYGNDSNGGEVMLRERAFSCILGAVRPAFEKEDVFVDYEQFKQLLNRYREELRDNDANNYSVTARDWAVREGIIQGNGTTPEGQPNYMWADFLTREQFVTMLYRFYNTLRG